MIESMEVIHGIFCFLMLSFTSQSSGQSIERLLDDTINEAMICDGRYNSEHPVIAFSTRRFMQAMAVKRRFQNAHDCATSQAIRDFDVNRENTWTFCVLGLCADQQCKCPIDIQGKHCERYNKKCWLVYCFLLCDNNQPILRCMCAPAFYRKHVQTNYYWYDEGLKRRYIEPPHGWKDDLLRQDDRRIIAEVMTDLEDYHFDVGSYEQEKPSSGRDFGIAQPPSAPLNGAPYDSTDKGGAPYMGIDRNKYLPNSGINMDDFFRPRPNGEPPESQPYIPIDYGELNPSELSGAREMDRFREDEKKINLPDRINEAEYPDYNRPGGQGRFDENSRKVNQPNRMNEEQYPDYNRDGEQGRGRFDGNGKRINQPDSNRPKQTEQQDYAIPYDEKEDEYSMPQEEEFEYYNEDYNESHNLSTDTNACFILVVNSLLFFYAIFKLM